MHKALSWTIPVTLVVLLVSVGYGVVFFFRYAAAVLGHPYGLGYTEGTIFCLTREWLQGGSLYGALDQPPYYVNIYPPGFFLVNTTFSELVDNILVSGRLLASGATILTAVLISLFVLRNLEPKLSRTSILSAFVASAIFLAHPFVIQETTILRVDMPAMFLTLLGMVLFTQSIGRSSLQYLCPIIFAVALFVKQSMLAAPIACFVIGIVHYPRATLRLLVLTGAVLGLLLYLSWRAFGPDFFFHIYTANDLGFSIQRSFSLLADFLVISYGLMIAGAFSVWLIAGQRVLTQKPMGMTRSILLAYLALVVGEMFFATSRPGTTDNWFIQPLLAISTVVGVGLGATLTRYRADDTRPANHLSVLSIVALLLWQGLVSAQNFPTLEYSQLARDQSRAIVYLKNISGPIITEDSSLACLAGKQAYANQFMVTNLARIGKWDETNYLQALRRGDVGALVLSFDLQNERASKSSLHRFTPGMMAAMKEGYVLRKKYGEYRIYTPKQKKPEP